MHFTRAYLEPDPVNIHYAWQYLPNWASKVKGTSLIAEVWAQNLDSDDDFKGNKDEIHIKPE